MDVAAPTVCPICGRGPDRCTVGRDDKTFRLLKPGTPLYEWARQFR